MVQVRATWTFISKEGRFSFFAAFIKTLSGSFNLRTVGSWSQFGTSRHSHFPLLGLWE